MKKKVIASALAVSMMMTGLGVANCSAMDNVIVEDFLGLTGEEQINDVSGFQICYGGQCQNIGSNFIGISDNKKPGFKHEWMDVCEKSTNKALCAGKKSMFLAKKGWNGFNFALNKLGQFSSIHKSTVMFISMVPYVGRSLKSSASALKNKVFPRKQVEADQVIKNLDESFKKIKGQKKAKKQMRKAIDGIVGKKKIAKLSKQKYKRGDVIYLVGPSGVGKTFSAEILAKALMGKYKPLVLSPANVDLVSKTSVVNQLFGLQNAFYYGGDMKEQANLVQYLNLNKGGGVVIINEYDKMHVSGLDEIFRTIMDDGEVNIQGQKIDCSGAIFIITSNESTLSATGKNLDKTKDDDGTGSRTHIKHDKAFMNRVNLIEFDNLKFEDYKEIAKDTFENIAKNFEKHYGMKINIDEMVENAAKRAEKINQGSRPIVDDMSNGFVQVLMEKRREDETGKNGKGKVFKSSYDAEKDEFSLSEINKDGEVVNITTSGVVFQDELDEQIRKEKALEDASKAEEEKQESTEELEMEKILANININSAAA